MRVLIVDDDDDLREVMAVILSSEGHEVSSAADGLDALQVLEQGCRPGLILIDMMMPRMDGEEFCGALRHLPGLGRTPVIIISGHKDALEKASELGALSGLVKPIDFDQLVNAVRNVAERTDPVS